VVGARKHVAIPCDDYSDGPTWPCRRTWDIYRRGKCIAQGFPTRALAREECQRLDDVEAEEG